MGFIKNGNVIVLLLMVSVPLLAGRGKKPAPLDLVGTGHMSLAPASFSPVDHVDEPEASQKDPLASSSFEQSPNLGSFLADPFIQYLAEHFGIPDTLTFVEAFGGLDVLVGYVQFLGGLERFVSFVEFVGGLEALIGHMQAPGSFENLMQHFSFNQQKAGASMYASAWTLESALEYLSGIDLLEPIIQEAIESLRIAGNLVPDIDTLDEALNYLHTCGSLEAVVMAAISTVSPFGSPHEQMDGSAMQTGIDGEVFPAEFPASFESGIQSEPAVVCLAPPVTPTSECDDDEAGEGFDFHVGSPGTRRNVVFFGSFD